MDALTKRVITSSLLLFLVVCSYANPTHSPWSACSVTCGGGAQTRTLTNGTTQERSCNTQSCPAVWGSWTYRGCADMSCTGLTIVYENRRCVGEGMCLGAVFRAVPGQICPICTTNITG